MALDGEPLTFTLGLGAQKAGTTWVHRYLRGSDRWAQGFRKEYHVFDALDLDQMKWRVARTLEAVEHGVAAFRGTAGAPGSADGDTEDGDDGGSGGPNPGAFMIAAMMAQPAIYFDYFSGLLQRPGKTLAADFTPDYALLGADRVRQIRRGFDRHGVRTRAIFLMRDPVDRTISAVRMRKRFLPDQAPWEVGEAVERMHTDQAIASRSDYTPTLAMLDEVFAPEETYVGLYEELFDESAVQAICDVVGIPFHQPDFEVRHNANTVLDTEVPEDVQRRVAQSHADVYEAVSRRLDRDVAEVWPSARLL